MKDELILQNIKESLINIEEEKCMNLMQDALDDGFLPVEIIEEGLSPGMLSVGEQFEDGAVFLPQVMMVAALMEKCVAFLNDNMPESEASKIHGIVVIGTVEGDVHDIGKNIVKVLLNVNGFEVHDVGRDALLSKFIEKAKEVDADIIASSALMTGTMEAMGDLESEIKAAGIHDRVKTMVGGAPVTQYWADKIGADAYAENAGEAVKLVSDMVK
ncbi:corrinoid protein [Methanohalophilus profundi]|uniref:corrinoid protein n=1 Tax=Methanohalophilus profundi TaxID=2138083 RepID=UPI00101CBD89|nr:B12-binding domain-containing protein [Methanohalophilus profundi]